MKRFNILKLVVVLSILLLPIGVNATTKEEAETILSSLKGLKENADGTCTAKIHPPLYTPKTKNKDDDFYVVTRQLTNILENEIISDPEMWFWVHDRWKDGRRRFGGKKRR